MKLSGMRYVLFALTLLTLIGCGGPREDPVPRGYALKWHDVMTVKVIKTWDLVQTHVDTHPAITHVLEVEVLEGPPRYQGKILFLPFDTWATGVREPPSKGAVETIMPSQWVTQSRSSRGAPTPSWGR